MEATTVFPSTTAAAITTRHTARTPQEHGNMAYFVWLDEFEQVTQMLRWGPAIKRRGSYFDDPRIDARAYVKAPSIHGRLRERGVATYVIEPEVFRNEAMTRMHGREATYVGYQLPPTTGTRSPIPTGSSTCSATTSFGRCCAIPSPASRASRSCTPITPARCAITSRRAGRTRSSCSHATSCSTRDSSAAAATRRSRNGASERSARCSRPIARRASCASTVRTSAIAVRTVASALRRCASRSSRGGCDASLFCDGDGVLPRSDGGWHGDGGRVRERRRRGAGDHAAPRLGRAR